MNMKPVDRAPALMEEEIVGPLDPDTRRVVRSLHALHDSVDDPAERRLDPADLRRDPSEVGDKPSGARDLVLPGADGLVPARLHLPPDGSPDGGLLMYLHGGGFVAGDIEGADRVCQRIARGARCHVLAVAYRLAPEAPFPAAVDDCAAALRWAFDSAPAFGWRGDRLAVGGESAGGNLAAVCARQWTRSAGVGVPLCLQLLICPLTDFRHRSWPSRRGLAGSVVLPAEHLRSFERHYLRCDADRADPRASPLAARDLSGLPPAHVVVAEVDPLHDEGVAYAQALAEAGVQVTLRSYRSLHAFVGMHEQIALGRQALDGCIEAIRRAFARGAPVTGT